MNEIKKTILVTLSLALTIDVAGAATAGHFFKPSTPVADSSEDVTGSIRRSPNTPGGDVTGSIRKPAPDLAKPKTAPAR